MHTRQIWRLLQRPTICLQCQWSAPVPSPPSLQVNCMISCACQAASVVYILKSICVHGFSSPNRRGTEALSLSEDVISSSGLYLQPVQCCKIRAIHWYSLVAQVCDCSVQQGLPQQAIHPWASSLSQPVTYFWSVPVLCCNITAVASASCSFE